jgi:hypothetical protein
MVFDQPVQKFIQAAVKSSEAQVQGNSKVVNKQHKILTGYYDVFRENFSKYQSQLTQLLNHENSYVRLHTACCLIPLSPTDAKATLEQLSSERNLLGFIAETTLKEWEKGTLKI